MLAYLELRDHVNGILPGKRQEVVKTDQTMTLQHGRAVAAIPWRPNEVVLQQSTNQVHGSSSHSTCAEVALWLIVDSMSALRGQELVNSE